MATPAQQPAPQEPQRAPVDQAQRSEGLLPVGAGDDGRYDVAEEVNADQQSDRARRVGKPPADPAATAMADAARDTDH